MRSFWLTEYIRAVCKLIPLGTEGRPHLLNWWHWKATNDIIVEQRFLRNFLGAKWNSSPFFYHRCRLSYSFYTRISPWSFSLKDISCMPLFSCVRVISYANNFLPFTSRLLGQRNFATLQAGIGVLHVICVECKRGQREAMERGCVIIVFLFLVVPFSVGICWDLAVSRTSILPGPAN